MRVRRRRFRIVRGAAHRTDRRAERLDVTRARAGWTRRATGPVSGYDTWTLELELEDGTDVANVYVDRGAAERDLEELAGAAGYRLGAIPLERAPAPPAERPAPRWRLRPVGALGGVAATMAIPC